MKKIVIVGSCVLSMMLANSHFVSASNITARTLVERAS